MIGSVRRDWCSTLLVRLIIRLGIWVSNDKEASRASPIISHGGRESEGVSSDLCRFGEKYIARDDAEPDNGWMMSSTGRVVMMA